MELIKAGTSGPSSKEYQEHQRFELIMLLAQRNVDSMVMGHTTLSEDEISQIVKNAFTLGRKVEEHGGNLHKLMCSHLANSDSDAEHKET